MMMKLEWINIGIYLTTPCVSRDNSQQRKIILILTWHIKENWHCCNVFQRTLLQQMSTAVTVFMRRHQTGPFACTMLTTWISVVWLWWCIHNAHGKNVNVKLEYHIYPKYLGPVVQSMVSLTSLLMTNSLTLVAKVFSNTLKLLLQNVSSFCNAKASQSFLHFFSKTINVFAIFQDDILMSI